MVGTGVITRDEVGMLGPQPGSENAACEMVKPDTSASLGHEKG